MGEIQENLTESMNSTEYMKECKAMLEKGTLTEEYMPRMQRLVGRTKGYEDIITYIRASIQFKKMKTAKKWIKFGMDNEKFTAQQREKFEEILKQIEELERKQIKKMYDAGKTTHEMAKELDMSLKEVRACLIELTSQGNIVVQPVKTTWKDQVARVEKLYDAGKSPEKIAKEIGASLSRVKSWIQGILQEKIQELYLAGRTEQEIKDTLHVNDSMIVRSLAEVKREMAQKLVNQGISKTEIAKILQISFNTAINYIGTTTQTETVNPQTYMEKCKQDLESGGLTEDQLSKMETIATSTGDEEYMKTYIKACIRFNKIIKARSTLMDFVSGDPEKEARFKQIIERLDFLEQKRVTINLLKIGVGISGIEEATGLSKNEILKIKQELQLQSQLLGDSNPPKVSEER